MAAFPDPALVWLVGPAGSGKSTWAVQHYRPAEIVSSDELRGRLGSGEADLSASADAFEVLERIAAARLGRGLTAVVDTLGFDHELRQRLGAAADQVGTPCFAVVFDTDIDACLVRNGDRPRPVPVGVLRSQVRRHPRVVERIIADGWNVERVAGAAAGSQVVPSRVRSGPDRRSGLKFYLHISRFDEGAPSSVVETARAAAEVGFAGISLMDHLVQIPQVGRRWDPILDPYVTLARLVATAPGLEMGVLVSPVTFRHVAVLAKMLATLDVLSEGMAFCGLGAGWFESEHSNLGLEFPPSGERLDRLEDTIGALRALWGPGSKPFETETITLLDTTGYPRPVRGTIPILIGGGGERRTIPIAARLADRWNLSSRLDRLDEKLFLLRAECERIGRDPTEIETSVLDPTLVGSDRADLAELVERYRGQEDAAAFSRRLRAGTVDQQVERYGDLAQKVDAVFVSLRDASAEGVRRFAPVLAAFHG